MIGFILMHPHGPFSDCSSRAGRLIRMKDCLRRGEYYHGIDMRDENSLILTEAVRQAQDRFWKQMKVPDRKERARKTDNIRSRVQ